MSTVRGSQIRALLPIASEYESAPGNPIRPCGDAVTLPEQLAQIVDQHASYVVQDTLNGYGIYTHVIALPGARYALAMVDDNDKRRRHQRATALVLRHYADRLAESYVSSRLFETTDQLAQALREDTREWLSSDAQCAPDHIATFAQAMLSDVDWHRLAELASETYPELLGDATTPH